MCDEGQQNRLLLSLGSPSLERGTLRDMITVCVCVWVYVCMYVTPSFQRALWGKYVCLCVYPGMLILCNRMPGVLNIT